MAEENTTPTPTPQSAEAPQQPVESSPSPDSSNKSGENKPAAFTFLQKAQLVKKKYEYINKQEMDAVAAEAAARRDLGFPEMTAVEQEKATKPNIFQRILKVLGITALLNRKKGDLKEKADTSPDLFAKVQKTKEECSAEEDEKPAQSDQVFSSAEISEDKPVEDSTPQNLQPEAKPTGSSPAEIFPSADNSESKSEDKPPQQPQV